MKNILLPTDLSVRSLWPVHQLLQDHPSQKPVVQVVHLLQPPTSMGDLLSSRSDKPFRSVPPAFYEAMDLLRCRYSEELGMLQFRFVYGSTSRYFRNFLDANRIDSIYTIKNHKYEGPFDQSVDLTQCLAHCKVPVHEVGMVPSPETEFTTISDLLYQNEFTLRTAK